MANFLGPSLQADTKEIVRYLYNMLRGKLNVTGSVTLTANAASTTVNAPNIGPDSVILFSPTTANAAAALTGMYISAQTAETSFVITHANNAQADKTFGYVILG
jgi:hypothetical protein